MSGSTIGGVVGAGIGFVVSGFNPYGAYWGWTIGSIAGAIIAPENIRGPQLGDMQVQSSQDGVSRVYGYGTYPVEQTWLMWRDEVHKFTRKQKSKGGPTQTTNHASVSYAIAVGRGPISGFKLITENGKIVFDARTDAELTAIGYTSEQIAEQRAAQAKFLQNTAFYYGTDSQIPDPTMVAVEGAGNVPAYSGTAYFVVKDKDITQTRSIPVYSVVVANCGERHDGGFSGQILITGAFTDFLKADATESPELSVIPPETGAGLANAACAVNENGVWMAFSGNGIRYSTDGMQSWSSAGAGRTSQGRFAVHGPGGWLIQHSNTLARASTIPTDASAYTIVADTGGSYGNAMMNVYEGGRFISSQRFYEQQMFLSTYDLDATWTRTVTNDANSRQLPDGGYIRLISDIIEFGGSLYCCCGVFAGGAGLTRLGGDIRRSDDGGVTWPHRLYRTSVADFGNTTADQLASGNGHIIALSRNASLCYTSADGWAEPHSTGVSFLSPGQDWQLDSHGRRIVFVGEHFYIIGRFGMVVTQDGITFSEVIPYPGARQDAISIAGRTETGSGTPIPDAPGHYIDPLTGHITGPTGIQIDPCQPTLAEIVSAECNSRGVSEIDVSELTDSVTGFRIANVSTPQRNVQALQPGYSFDSSEFDGRLHFVKRGRAPTFALTMDDLVERDGDAIQWEGRQESELLRKVTVGYLDPMTNYTATTQPWERTSATVRAEGEGTMELPVVGTGDWARQVAHKSGKVAWGERDECTFHVSIERADLVTAAVGTITDDEQVVHTIRIERIEDEGLVRMITARRTSEHLYESNASGVPKPLPRYPGSDMRGPTDGLLLNIPVLIDANDVPGIHWAASGLLSGWVGAQLQILRAGEWIVAGETQFSANTGTLLSPLPYHAGDMDTAHVLHVRMNDELPSVTYTQLLQERNPMAILRPDGTAEIVQPQTCIPIAPGVYECTSILRNRLDSGASNHDAGARVVFLDESVGYATLDPTDIGAVLTYRFVTLGTDPDAAPVQSITLTSMESQREWRVAELTVAQDGDDYTLTWQPRHRLGNDVFPVRSSHWIGYEVGWTDGVDSHSEIITAETITFNLPGASDITFSVAQVNQFSGAGPAETVHIP